MSRTPLSPPPVVRSPETPPQDSKTPGGPLERPERLALLTALRRAARLRCPVTYPGIRVCRRTFAQAVLIPCRFRLCPGHMTDLDPDHVAHLCDHLSPPTP